MVNPCLLLLLAPLAALAASAPAATEPQARPEDYAASTPHWAYPTDFLAAEGDGGESFLTRSSMTTRGTSPRTCRPTPLNGSNMVPSHWGGARTTRPDRVRARPGRSATSARRSERSLPSGNGTDESGGPQQPRTQHMITAPT
mgnify:CR=1 FL=1